MNPSVVTPSTTPEDMALSRHWTGQFVSEPANLPVSFVYDGRAVSGIPAGWNPVVKRKRIDANIIETDFKGTEKSTGLSLRVEFLEYRDYPVVEWTAWLTNQSDRPTPLISDLLALNSAFEGSSPVVYHCNGDFYNEDGYKPEESTLRIGDSLSFAPTGGRPCDGAFPYYRVAFKDCGLTLAIGWPGQWSVSFKGTANGALIRAGQEKTHLRLMPGETIRTPRMALLSWKGDTTRAVNLWRRWYLEHVLPRPDGRPMQPLMASAGTDTGEEFTAATTENQIRYMDKFKKVGFNYDVWWIDAGWYPCYDENHQRRWPLTGTWEPDAERFPTGFKPVSDNVEKNGARLLVWFEPERVDRSSWLNKNHPEWLLRITSKEEWLGRSSLLNLGIPECRHWLTDHVCKLIQDSGIKIYRQDFNFPPLEYWRVNEAEDRQGINENLHVQGYLQYWDDLLRRNPGLWIDSCSSGGRRNDLETMRRSVPLHYTDYGYGIHPVKLAFHHTLYSWIPYFKECTLSYDVNKPEDDARFDKQIDSFSFHCGMAAMLFTTIDIRRDDHDFALGVKMIGIWRRAAELLLYGDYYPLTPFSRNPDRWVAWQFDRPERGDGFIQGFRLAACGDESLTVHPCGFQAGMDYVFENPESGESVQISGSALLSGGFTFKLPKRSAAIWFYHRRQ